MTHTISDKIGAYLGWCPSARAQVTRASSTGRANPSGITEPEPPQPGISPVNQALPHWMTAVALAILVTTFFVGGNIWWVAFVLVVLVVLVVIHIRTVQTHRGA